MKTKAIAINDVFNVLLFGLPQGVLLGLIWMAYTAWMSLIMLKARVDSL